eukprot:TRINITY_DN6263_c0_g1_i1.p1 TRINITY_DN6263_c0_g1~~TRINITY_DN6263_c0_g1_i1.p1  ORF type:complete len:341 (+),score=57.20 TRINITY_DN6263_c0_g1_i1:40-1062(+)
MFAATVAVAAGMAPLVQGVLGGHVDFTSSEACSPQASLISARMLTSAAETSLLQQATERTFGSRTAIANFKPESDERRAITESNASLLKLTSSSANSSLGTSSATPTRFLLHHMWKCGGTHMCDVAKESGFVVPENPGCHRLQNDSTSLWQPCAVGQPGLATLPFDVLGHECAVDSNVLDEGEAEGFAWIGIVRDPVEQALSWLSHARRGNKTFFSAMSFEEWVRVCAETDCGWYTFVPNLQTRWLAGGRCLKDPSEADCVSLAVRNLGRMAAVLEQSGGSLLGREKLKRFGWVMQPEVQHESGAASVASELSPQARQYIEKVQHLDIALLSAARAQGIV